MKNLSKLDQKLGNDAEYKRICNRLGVESLHSFQKEAIEAVDRGQDALVLVPTGWGKSVCYIAPALKANGLVLVVSPLIALMRDQLKGLSRMGLDAATLDSLQSSHEKSDTMTRLRAEQLDLLFVSPERLSSLIFRQLLSQIKISLIAIDEAHCVNQWGHDFRPAYRQLGEYVKEVSSCPLIALTATAASKDRQQITDALKMQDFKLITHALRMDHIDIKLIRVGKLADQLSLLLQAVKNQSLNTVGIIYANSRRRVEEISRMMQSAGVDGVGCYHAGMEESYRLHQQRGFENGQLRIMVATKAFGMGINKANVRFVIHANMPASLESYVQEIGRAGRDQKKAQAILFYGPKDFYTQRFLIERSYPDVTLIRLAYHCLRKHFIDQRPMLENSVAKLLVSMPQFDLSTASEILSFLTRYDVFKRFSMIDSDFVSNDQEYISWNSTQPDIDYVCRVVLDQKEDRMLRLRAMHRMIKHNVNPHEYLADYFS